MAAETGGQGEVHGGVSTRAAPWVAWSLCATSLLALALALLLISLGSSEPLPKGFSPWQERAIEAIGLVGAPVLGGLISSRRPKNPYGWLWCVTSLSQHPDFLTGIAAGGHAVEVEDFDLAYALYAGDPSTGSSTRVASFREGRIGYRRWAARTGRISPSVEDRYDHDVDELMA